MPLRGIAPCEPAPFAFQEAAANAALVGCNTRRALHHGRRPGWHCRPTSLIDEWCNAPAGYYTLPTLHLFGSGTADNAPSTGFERQREKQPPPVPVTGKLPARRPTSRQCNQPLMLQTAKDAATRAMRAMRRDINCLRLPGVGTGANVEKETASAVALLREADGIVIAAAAGMGASDRSQAVTEGWNA